MTTFSLFRRFVMVAVIAAASISAQAQDSTAKASQTAAQAPAQKNAPAAKAKTTSTKPTGEALPPGLPAGAVSYKPYFWRYVDKTGQAWIYHWSPFGLVHDKESPDDKAEIYAIKHPNSKQALEKRPEPPAPGELAIAADLGDSLEFTRTTPFGKTHWTSKKSSLSDEEAAIWAKVQAANATPAADASK